MLLYRFFNKERGLESIEDRRLKISRLLELNDPFEFLGVDLSDAENRKALQRVKERLNENRGIICFSKAWHNPLLWSHYADKHKGLCLGFEIPDKLLVDADINYVEERLSWPDKLDKCENREEFMGKVVRTKFEHWRYEEEYRLFWSLEEKIGGYYYVDFSENLVLKQIIVGCESDITQKKITIRLGDLEKRYK